jgi:digeranylgeranylglycerophospholipid reductase
MDNSNNFDVLVAGAGPAGSMVAHYAAKGGCSVALLERNERVSNPVRCGEGIGFKGLTAIIDHIDERWIQTCITRLAMISPSGIRVGLSHIEKGFILNREIMDNDLVQYAVKSGASYFPSTPVVTISFDGKSCYTCRTPAKTFTASCVVLADGVESRLARDLGWNTSLSLKDIESCAFCHVVHDSIRDDTVELYIGNTRAPGGYVWIMPREKGKANVGLGVLGSRCGCGKAKLLLERFIKERFSDCTVSDLHCGGVPVGRWVKPLVKEGALLVGDAARQVNSISGGGIAYALYAGRIAGESIAHAHSGNGIDYALLKEYQKKWASRFGRQQERSYKLKKALMNADDAFYDAIARSFVKEDPDKIGILQIFLRAFIKRPLFLLRAFMLFR